MVSVLISCTPIRVSNKLAVKKIRKNVGCVFLELRDRARPFEEKSSNTAIIIHTTISVMFMHIRRYLYLSLEDCNATLSNMLDGNVDK